MLGKTGAKQVYCDGIRQTPIAASRPREIISMQAEIDIHTLPVSTIEADSRTDISGQPGIILGFSLH